MTAPDIERLKHEARTRARFARAAVRSDDARRAADALAGRLDALPQLARARTLVLVYAALPEEIDPAPTVERMLARGVRTAYPRVAAPGVLSLHLASEPQLAEGRFGIREPIEGAVRVEPDRIDAVFVPGVAFDEARFRLGYGGGYYDRLLPLLRADAFTIGLAFDEQLVGQLPVDEHDVQLDAVATPSRLITG